MAITRRDTFSVVFELELDSSGKRNLYRKTHWKEDWNKVTPDVLAEPNAEAAEPSDARKFPPLMLHPRKEETK